MKILFLRKLLLIVLMMLPFSALAETATQKLAQMLDHLHGMQAQFAQIVQNGQGEIMQQSSGSMALLRPGKFRWDTKTPSHQLLIADGRKIWFYDEDLQQATVQPQRSAHNGSPAMLLDGSTISLTTDFIVKEIPASNDMQTFKLTPRKKESLFQTVYLNFRQNQLQQMRLIDNLGQETEISFTQVNINQALSPSLFHFTPPKGVEVINQ